MKQKQGTLTIYRKLILPCLIAACVILLMIVLSGCGNNSLDSDENRTLLESSSLFSLELKNNNLSKHVEGSWLAVQPYYDENNDKRWSIVGCSEGSLDENTLSALDILVVINSAQHSAEYRGSGGKISIGTSEYAYIEYYDASTGDCYGKEMIHAGKLPDKTTSLPNYTISANKIRETIEKRFLSRIDPDYNTWTFEMDGTVLLDVSALDYSGITIPEYITEISAEAGESLQWMDKLTSIKLPENIEIISMPDMHEKVTLGVYEGSYAEQYAIENGYVYYHIGTLDGYLPEGVYEYDKVNYPDVGYGYLHIPSSVTYIRDGVFTTNNAVFVVQEGSYAEQAAIESGHIYCYEGQQDCVYLPEGAYLFIPQEVVELTSVLHLPGDAGISDQMDDYLSENAAHLTFVVSRGSHAEWYAQQNGISVLYEDVNSY
jgi:hypothetical protein